MIRILFYLVIVFLTENIFAQYVLNDIEKLNINKEKIKASGIKSIIEVIYYGYPGKLEERKRTIYHYNENGFLIEKSAPVRALDANYFNIKYFYDDKGKLSREELVKVDPFDNTFFNIISRYGYDEKGRLVNSESKYQVGSDFRIEKYNYDEQSNVIQVYSNDSGEGEYINFYKYDLKNKLILSERFVRRNNKDELINTIRYEYNYDSTGLITQSAKYYDSTGYEKSYFEYDEAGRKITEVLINSWSRGSMINYDYDENGKLVKTRTTNSMEDFTMFQYDPNGNLLLEKTVDYYGNSIRETNYIFEYYNK
jgi:hypothetical protein